MTRGSQLTPCRRRSSFTAHRLLTKLYHFSKPEATNIIPQQGCSVLAVGRKRTGLKDDGQRFGADEGWQRVVAVNHDG